MPAEPAARCPRAGCDHVRRAHKLELRGPWNRSEYSGSCGVRGCLCTAWDTSVDDARARFAAAWREAHPDQTYSDRWTCSLCGYVVQVAEAGDRPIASRVVSHIDAHGQDWLDLEQAGQPADTAARSPLAEGE